MAIKKSFFILATNNIRPLVITLSVFVPFAVFYLSGLIPSGPGCASRVQFILFSARYNDPPSSMRTTSPWTDILNGK